MTVQTQIRAASVVAVLNFLKPMAGRPRTLQYEPEPGIPQRNAEDEAHLVSIHDARPLAPTLSLDVQGFEYLHAPTSFAAYNDDAAIRSFYYPKVKLRRRDRRGSSPSITMSATPIAPPVARPASVARCPAPTMISPPGQAASASSPSSGRGPRSLAARRPARS